MDLQHSLPRFPCLASAPHRPFRSVSEPKGKHKSSRRDQHQQQVAAQGSCGSTLSRPQLTSIGHAGDRQLRSSRSPKAWRTSRLLRALAHLLAALALTSSQVQIGVFWHTSFVVPAAKRSGPLLLACHSPSHMSQNHLVMSHSLLSCHIATLDVPAHSIVSQLAL